MTESQTPASNISYAGKVRAPEFPDGLEWVNTSGKPVKLAQLKGRIVILDFWTYC